MPPKLEDIFDKNRLASYSSWFLLFYYFPLGLTIFTIRFFIGAHALLISVIFAKLSSFKRFVLRNMCVVLGFIVIEKDSENYKENVKVIVSNHITTFDHLAINLIRPAIVPSVWDLPPFLNWILGYTDYGATQGRQVLIQNVKQSIKNSNLPVLIFPEGATTNGKKGLLKFSTWAFSLDQAVHPVIIKVHRLPFMEIAPSTLGSRWWSDMFWFLFVPQTLFLVRHLPPMERSCMESIDQFCKRVQDTMCQELGVHATNFSSLDKVEYSKLLLCEPSLGQNK